MKEILNYEILMCVMFQHDLLYLFNEHLLTLIKSTLCEDELGMILISKYTDIDINIDNYNIKNA